MRGLVARLAGQDSQARCTMRVPPLLVTGTFSTRLPARLSQSIDDPRAMRLARCAPPVGLRLLLLLRKICPSELTNPCQYINPTGTTYSLQAPWPILSCVTFLLSSVLSSRNDISHPSLVPLQ